jgi:hypothetical protein
MFMAHLPASWSSAQCFLPPVADLECTFNPSDDELFIGKAGMGQSVTAVAVPSGLGDPPNGEKVSAWPELGSHVAMVKGRSAGPSARSQVGLQKINIRPSRVGLLH